MKTTSTLESLTKKIHSHCPELLELSFGCEVRLPGNIGRDRVVKFVSFVSEDSNLMRVHGNGTSFVNSWQPDEYEILGRPIELPHVLRAIQKESHDYAIDTNGYFLKMDKVGAYLFELIRWDLTKPLSGQSEETLRFINSII